MKHIKLFEDFAKITEAKEWTLHLDLGKVDPAEFEDWAGEYFQRSHKVKVAGKGSKWTITGKGNNDSNGSSPEWIKNRIEDSWTIDKIKVDESVDEMASSDVHYKEIMAMYNSGSFAKKKVGAVVCKNPNATQKQIEDELGDAGYEDMIEFIDALGINESHEDLQNYMFFSNLETIKRKSESILAMDFKAIDEMLNAGGHDWAADHITVAKENIDQVENFLVGQFEDGKEEIPTPSPDDKFEPSVDESRVNEGQAPNALKYVKSVSKHDWVNDVTFDEVLAPLAEHIDSYAARQMGDLEYSKKTFTLFYDLVDSMAADHKEAEKYQ